jgi:hypothetical protein
MRAQRPAAADHDRRSALVAALLLLGACSPTRAGGAEAAAGAAVGLSALGAVSLHVELAPQGPPLDPGALTRRLAAGLRGEPRAPRLDPASRDRLLLRVGVFAISSAGLRGFWLPFSGDYAVGSVRLALERPARLESTGAPLPAVVWSAEQPVAAAGRAASAAVLAAVDLLAAEFAAACATAPP